MQRAGDVLDATASVRLFKRTGSFAFISWNISLRPPCFGSLSRTTFYSVEEDDGEFSKWDLVLGPFNQRLFLRSSVRPRGPLKEKKRFCRICSRERITRAFVIIGITEFLLVLYRVFFHRLGDGEVNRSPSPFSRPVPEASFPRERERERE